MTTVTLIYNGNKLTEHAYGTVNIVLDIRSFFISPFIIHPDQLINDLVRVPGWFVKTSEFCEVPRLQLEGAEYSPNKGKRRG